MTVKGKSHKKAKFMNSDRQIERQTGRQTARDRTTHRKIGRQTARQKDR